MLIAQVEMEKNATSFLATVQALPDAVNPKIIEARAAMAK